MPRPTARTKKQNQFSNAECLVLTILKSAPLIGCYQTMILSFTDKYGINREEIINTLQGLITKQLITCDISPSKRSLYALSDNGNAILHQCEIYKFEDQLKLNHSELHEQLTILNNATMSVLFMPNEAIKPLCNIIAQNKSGFIEGLRNAGSLR